MSATCRPEVFISATSADLALRVRELQTHVEHLTGELKKARSWLGRGLAAGIALVLLLGADIWWLRLRADETAKKVATQSTQVATQRNEIAELRARLAKQSELTEAVLAKTAQPGEWAKLQAYLGTRLGDWARRATGVEASGRYSKGAVPFAPPSNSTPPAPSRPTTPSSPP